MPVFTKAQGVNKDTVIWLKGEPPLHKGADWIELCHEFYAREGAAIGDLLIANLPGGTLDQLLVRLLENKASLLRVPIHGPVSPQRKETSNVS